MPAPPRNRYRSRRRSASEQPLGGLLQRWYQQLAVYRFERRWLLLLLPLLLLLAAGWWLADPHHLPLRQVVVEGSLERVDRQQLQQQLLPLLNVGFLFLDMAALQQQVAAQRWVRRALLRRIWPDTLVVQIEEQQPIAQWYDGDLLNDSGERFDGRGVELTTTLPLLTGPDASERLILERYRELQRLLVPLNSRITALTLSARGAWSLQLDNGIEVVLGRESLEERLLRLVRVWQHHLRSRVAMIERLDLRYTNGFAVRWRAGVSPSGSGA